jgi:hypothetical protein
LLLRLRLLWSIGSLLRCLRVHLLFLHDHATGLWGSSDVGHHLRHKVRGANRHLPLQLALLDTMLLDVEGNLCKNPL